MGAPPTDPDVTSVAWDLAPLLDGAEAPGTDPAAAVDALLASAQERADRFAEVHAGRVAELDGPALVAAMHELATITDLAGRAGSYAHLRFSADTADPARRRAAPARPGALDGHRDASCCSSSSSGRRVDDDRADELLEADGPRLRPPPPAHRAPLPAAPALRARGERSSPRRPSPAAPPGAACSASTSRRSTSSSPDEPSRSRSSVALARLMSTRPRRRAAAPPRRHRRARARPAHARLHLQHAARTTRPSTTACAATRTGSRAATSPTRPPTSRSRRWSRPCAGALRAPAALVPPQGAAARHRPPRRLRPHGRGRPPRTSRSAGPRRARSSLDAYGGFSPELGELVRRFFDERWIDAPVRPGKRGGAFCAYTVPTAHPYVLLNYTAQRARRAHARPRARARRARRARAAAQGIFQHGARR